MNESDLNIIDLNDWIFLNHPDIYEATKYISNTEYLMKIWTMVWKESGCPEIREIR